MPDIRSIEPLRRRICSIIDIGTADDFISRAYDIFYTLVILVNLAVTIAYTFDGAEARCGGLLPFGCSGWYGSSGCSGSTPTTIP